MKSSSHTVVAYLRSLVARHGAADDDRELLGRYTDARDGDAFAVLMLRHGPMVLNLARRIVGDEQLAEDVFQAAFLLLARKTHTIRRPESLPCWLHGVAGRLALQARRARRRRHERESRVRPASPPTPLDDLTVREFLSVLDEELNQLPENYRAPLILCCLEGLSREEAAKRLGCSPDALKGRLERGRERLRSRLEKLGLTLPAALGGMLLFGGATSPVPAALTQATLRTAARESNASPAVAALIQEAMRNMVIHKLKALGAVVVLLALAGTGVGMMALRPQAAKENAPPATVDDKPVSAKKHVDIYGDPLPEGAIMRLGTIRRRAVGATLAVSEDGKSIIGVRGGKSIYIWDAVTGELRQLRELPGESLQQVILSKDGRWMARVVDARDYRLEIWNPRNGNKFRDLTIKDSGYIMPVALSADGKRVAAVGHRRRKAAKDPSEHLVRVWELADGKELFSADVRIDVSDGVLAFAPDGNHLLASFGSTNEGLYCWDIATGKKLWQYKQIFGPASIEFTPDGKILSVDLGPNALDLATGKMEKIEGAPPIERAGLLTLTPDGRTLLISTVKGLIVWDLEHGKELRTLLGAGEDVVVTPDSKSVITNNGALQRWDLATGQAVWSDTSEFGHIGEVAVVKFSLDCKRLVSASTDGTVRLRDTTTGRPLRVWRGHAGQRSIRISSFIETGVKTLDISADGRRVVSAGTDECVKLWDITADNEFRTISIPRAENGEWGRRFYHVRISPDGRRVIGIFGPRGGAMQVGRPAPKLTDKLAVWDAETGELLEMHPVDLGGGIISPDGHTLLRGDNLIDIRSGKKIAELPDMGGLGHIGGFSCDGALVVDQATKKWKEKGINYVGSDGLRVWEAATGKIVVQLKTGYPWVAQTIFHPDSRYIAANDLLGIRLRDVRDDQNVAHYHMPETIRTGTRRGSYAGCLAFSRDGRRMATGMPDGTILVWNVSLPPARSLQLTAKELDTLWADLADADAAKAWRAVWRLADAPSDALPFLRRRVKPYPIASADLTRKLLADLDSDAFAVREAAVKRLKDLGLQAEPALRAALKANPSLEQRRRIEELLPVLLGATTLPTSEELRQFRALIVLERIGTPEARRMLEDVAKGPESARLTRQARAALMCLR